VVASRTLQARHLKTSQKKKSQIENQTQKYQLLFQQKNSKRRNIVMKKRQEKTSQGNIIITNPY